MRNGETEYSPVQDFIYRFHIEPGKAAYLGRLKLQLSDRATQRLTVENQQEEDLALLGTKHPALGGLQISYEVGRLWP